MAELKCEKPALRKYFFNFNPEFRRVPEIHFNIATQVLPMTKRLLLFSLFLLTSVRSFSQSLQLTQIDTILSNGDPFQILESHGYVKNISANPVRVVVSREIISLGPDHINYFCWGVNCYAPFTSESPDTLTLAPQQVNTSFKGYIDPSGGNGLSSVKYCFINADAPASDRTCYVAKYASGTSAAGKDISDRKSGVKATYDSYNRTITVNVAGGKIETWNMLGQKMDLDFRYDGSGMTADASILKTGYYFLFGVNELGPWSARVVVTRGTP